MYFLEIVLYFFASDDLLNKIKKEFEQAFPQKQVLVFIGSDWNHQSYQAAFADKDTFYLLLLPSSFKKTVDTIADETLTNNIQTLQLIAKATYLTIQDKALLFNLQV